MSGDHEEETDMIRSPRDVHPEKRKPLILLDRDGTVNVDCHYLSRPEDFELIPGAGEAIRRFKEFGATVAIVTNQSGIARGFYDLDTLELIHQRMHALLEEEGTRVDGVYACPHGPDDDCECRKPRTGLVRQAIVDLDADLETAFVIGDKVTDIRLGQAIGATTILVRTGKGAKVEREAETKPDHIADDLLAASELVLRMLQRNDAVA